MDGWDLALLIVAAYVAVVALVRLMLVRREQATARLRIELAQEALRKQAQEASPRPETRRAA